MDKDLEEAVAGPSEGGSVDQDILNVAAEGVIAEDGNYYIVTDDTTGDNEEVLLVVMNGDGETLETVSCVDGTGIEFLDQEHNLISTVEQTSVSSANEGVLYQIGYTGQSTSSQVTGDGSKVEGQYVLTGSKVGDQYVVAGVPQQKGLELGGSLIVGGNVQTVVESGRKLKTILPPNLVERLANKGTQGSSVSKKETKMSSTSENLNTKSSKQTTLGYTTISKSIGSQTPIATVTKNVVTIDSLKSLGNVLKSGSVSKMPQVDSKNSQSVAKQFGKAQDGRVFDTRGRSLLEKSIAMDREEMSKTADVLVELATSYPATVGLTCKYKTVTADGVTGVESMSRESMVGDSISSKSTSQMTDSKHDKKVYKDVTREEELEIILQEIENMCSKLSDFNEEFIVISINKTLRSRCCSSKVGKEFLDNNPDIVERFLQYSFGKKKTGTIHDKNKRETDKMAAETSISKSTIERTHEKGRMESEFVKSRNTEDKNKQHNEENIQDSESVVMETRQENMEVGTELAMPQEPSEMNTGENVEKSGNLNSSKTAMENNESVENQTPSRRSRRFEKNKMVVSPTLTGKISSKKSEMSPMATRNVSTKKLEVSSSVAENVGNKKTVTRNSRTSNTALTPKSTKRTCATMTDLDESENDEDEDGTDQSHREQQTREKSHMVNKTQNSKNGLKCSKCNICFTTKSNLKRHMKCHEKNKLFACEECGRKFARIDTMKDHVKQVHMNFKRTQTGEHGRFKPKSSDVDGSESENLTDMDSNDGNWSDDMSERGDNNLTENDSEADFLDSMDNFSDTPSTTNLSDRLNKTPEKDGVRRSSRKIKTTDKDSEMYIKDIFKCSLCGKNFFTLSSLKQHLENCATNEEYSCTKCKESFASKDLLKAHIKSTHKKRKTISSPLKEKSSAKKMKNHKNEEKEKTTGKKQKEKKAKVKMVLVDPKSLQANVTYMMDQDLTIERKKIKTANEMVEVASEQLASTSCEKCGQQCENIEEHMNIHHTSDFYSCEVCENVFSDLNQYRVHVLTKHCTLSESDPSEISPNLVKNGDGYEQKMVNDIECQTSCSSSDDQSSKFGQTKMEDESLFEKNGSFSCHICVVTFTNKNLLDKHLKLKHNQGDFKLPILVCETCGSEFHERYLLNNHRLTHVKNPNLFECGICLGNFDQKHKLDNHDCSTDGIQSKAKKPFPCKKCRLCFDTSGSLHAHYRKHFMKKTNKFCCKVCYKTFTCYMYLKRHVMYSHAKSRNYICDICGKDFKRLDTLTDHKRSHLPKDGTHKCHLCNKVFKHEYAVKKHWRNIHRDDKKNKSPADTSEFEHIFSATQYHMDDDLSVERKCFYDECWETTETIKSMDNNVDVSQDYFPCRFCRKKFTDEESFTEHTEEFGLSYIFCEECDKPFADFEFYKQHMLSVHHHFFSGIYTGESVKCDSCDIVFKNLYIYEKHLYRQHEGDKNLDTMLVCETCGQEFSHRNCFNHHRLSHPQNALELTCGICQSTFESRTSLVTHHCGFDASGFPIGMNLTCKLCAISFSSSDKLHFHLRGHFMKKTDAFFCKICLRQFKMYQYLRRHMMYTHKPSKELICEHCGKTFKRIDYLKEHLHSHLPKKDIECDICHKFFKHPRALQKHRRTHLNKGLTCETCGKQFSFSSNLKYHQLTHMERPKNFECDKCDKKFAKRTSLQNHLITHTTIKLENLVDGVRRFACPDCGKAFKRKDYLVEHRKYVHQPLDGTHKCEICNKVFKHALAVKKHMAVHNDDKPHMCDICGQGFKQAGNMRKHRQTHSNERRFRCEECGKMFKLKEDMKKHAKRHLINSNDFDAAEKLGKVYSCEICGKKFASNLSRVVHIRSHTNERPFSCQYCEKAFKDMSHLRRHEQLHAKSPKTDIGISSRVAVETGQNQIQDIMEASDISYLENGELQLDQAEHVIIQDIPLPETVEEVQTIKVITPNTNHSKQTIIYIPSSSL